MVPVDTPTEGDEISFAIARSRTGDAAAFATVYRACHGRVYALCLRLVADRGVAEELTQDVFVKAWQALPNFRGDSRFTTWLHRIAVNTVVSHQRRRSPWSDWSRSGDAMPEVTVDPAPGRVIDLEAAIARLPTRARHVFVLVDVEGFSHEEASTSLDMAIGTSKAHLHRARQLLRGMLV